MKRKIASASEKWNRMAWKTMKTSHQDLMADDAMFFGLEELDGNAYKLSKTETGSYEFDDSFCLPESNSNEDSDDKLVNVDFSIGHTDDNTKSKKNKKKKTLSDDNKKGDESLENSVDVISKKNSKKKQKVDEEVLDGIDAVEAIPGKAKTKKDKKKKKSKENIKEDMDVDTTPVLEPDDHLELWGASEVATGVEVHQLIYEALVKLNYVTPTAIQQQAIPVTLKNSIVGSSSDIVGAAETGSGKTLAFVIPIIHSLLLEYSEWHNEDFVHHYKRNIYSLIIAPTRELALQIAGVANDIPKQFSVNDKDVHSSLQRPIGIVSLTGGLSEHKQKRQLYNGMYSKNPRHFVHMIVATPGRFCELLTASNQTNNSNVFNVASSSSSNNDIDISSIVDSGLTHEGDNDMLLLCRQNWRKLRFLVVDEADRLVEEGHFPELDRILEFIKPTVNKGRNTDPMRDVTADADGVEHEEIPECETALRQTLLFSATSISSKTFASGNIATTTKSILKSKKDKKRLHVVDVEGKSGKLDSLATPIQNLLQLSASNSLVTVVDVTGKGKIHSDSDGPSDASGVTKALADSLPQQLLQCVVQTPKEEKDVTLMNMLLQSKGKTLVFVNSIKGVRRVDGLLHLMGFHNAKSIHSQMQQRHRLNSMEYFAKSTDGVLIATDVAARGLDISDIKNVFHYDIARSPQVYVHRSGRTARGLNGSGVTVSLVSPVDHQHYADICRELKVSQLPSFFTPNGTIVTKEANTPDTVYHDMEILAEAVKLAKEIYKINFINAQESMESNWMKRMSDETDILMDDATLGEQIVGNEKKYSEDMEKAKKDSKVVHEKKMQLQSLVRTKFRKPNARPLSSNPVANNALIQTKSANKSGFSRRNENKKMSKHKLEKQQVLAGRSWKKDRLSVIVAR